MEPVKHSETVVNLLNSIRISKTEQNYFEKRLHSILKTFNKSVEDTENKTPLFGRRKFFLDNLKDSIKKSVMVCPDYQFAEKFPALHEYISNKNIPLTKKVASELETFLDPKNPHQKKILVHLIYAYPVTFKDKNSDAAEDRLKFVSSGYFTRDVVEQFKLMKENLAFHISTAPRHGAIEYELIERRGIIKEDLPKYVINPSNQSDTEIELTNINGSNELYIIHGILPNTCKLYLKNVEETNTYEISSFGRESLCCSIIGNGKYESYRHVSLILSVDPTSIFRTYHEDAGSDQSGDVLTMRTYKDLLNTNNVGFYLKDLFERVYLALDPDVKEKLNVYPYMKSAELLVLQSNLNALHKEFRSEFDSLFNNNKLNYSSDKLFDIFNSERHFIKSSREFLEAYMKECEYGNTDIDERLKKFDDLIEEVFNIKNRALEIKIKDINFEPDKTSFIKSMISEIKSLSESLNKDTDKILIEEISKLSKLKWEKEDTSHNLIPSYLFPPFFLNKLSHSYNEVNILSNGELNMKVGARPVKIVGIFLSSTAKTDLEKGNKELIEIALLAKKVNLPILTNF